MTRRVFASLIGIAVASAACASEDRADEPAPPGRSDVERDDMVIGDATSTWRATRSGVSQFGEVPDPVLAALVADKRAHQEPPAPITSDERDQTLAAARAASPDSPFAVVLALDDIRNEIQLQEAQVTGHCLEMHVFGFAVPPEGRVIYMSDYFHGGTPD